MRSFFSRVIGGGVLAATALTLAACGSGSEAIDNDALVTEMGNIDSTASGTVSDNMTLVDGAGMDSGEALAPDSPVGNDAMMSSEAMDANMAASNAAE